MQPTPSDRFFEHIRFAANQHLKRVVKRVRSGTASDGQRDMGQDLDIFIDAIDEGRVTIAPRKE